MKSLRFKWVIAVVLSCILLLAAVAAAAPAGTGPDDALVPAGEWMGIQPGGAHWYAFNYDGKEGGIEAVMQVEPKGAALFKVFTPDQAQLWREQGKEQAIGASSYNDIAKAELWSGSFSNGGTYYLKVEPTGQGDAYYALTVNGGGVFMPLPAAAAEPAEVPVAMPAAPVAEAEPVVAAAAAPALVIEAAPAPVMAAAAETGGTGPDDAYVPAGEWMPIDSGASHWYAFNYDGKEGGIEAVMELDPKGAARFKVYTPDQAQLWREQGKDQSIGASSYNDIAKAELWSGSFSNGGTYYLKVEPTGQGEAYYALTVNGGGVSMPLPAAAAKPTEAPVAAAVAVAAAPTDMAGTGVDDAMTPTGEWKVVDAGGSQWYAFNYDGKESTIQIKLNGEPAQDLKFSVRTPEDVKVWQDTGNAVACGCGTKDGSVDADMSWAGSFTSPGTYYVVVEDMGKVNGPSSYALEVSGGGVWF